MCISPPSPSCSSLFNQIKAKRGARARDRRREEQSERETEGGRGGCGFWALSLLVLESHICLNRMNDDCVNVKSGRLNQCLASRSLFSLTFLKVGGGVILSVGENRCIMSTVEHAPVLRKWVMMSRRGHRGDLRSRSTRRPGRFALKPRQNARRAYHQRPPDTHLCSGTHSSRPCRCALRVDHRDFTPRWHENIQVIAAADLANFHLHVEGWRGGVASSHLMPFLFLHVGNFTLFLMFVHQFWDCFQFFFICQKPDRKNLSLMWRAITRSLRPWWLITGLVGSPSSSFPAEYWSNQKLQILFYIRIFSLIFSTCS